MKYLCISLWVKMTLAFSPIQYTQAKTLSYIYCDTPDLTHYNICVRRLILFP